MTDPNQPIAFPILIRFARTGLMRFIGHLDFQALQQAIFLRAGLKIVVGEGPTHRLRLKTSPPTPVGVESLCEFTYLLLTERIYPEEAERRLSEQCPDGIEIISVRDAGHLVRKNPLGAIEATGYSIDFGDDVGQSEIEAATQLLRQIKDGTPPENAEEDVSKFWGRILEISPENGSPGLLALQREGETFHAARCADYLEKTLNLPHYPIFRKLDYYRLKPSRRALFRSVV
jgi:radical SAM-linked protein